MGFDNLPSSRRIPRHSRAVYDQSGSAHHFNTHLQDDKVFHFVVLSVLRDAPAKVSCRRCNA